MLRGYFWKTLESSFDHIHIPQIPYESKECQARLDKKYIYY